MVGRAPENCLTFLRLDRLGCALREQCTSQVAGSQQADAREVIEILPHRYSASASAYRAARSASNSSRQSLQRSRCSWTSGMASAVFLPARCRSAKRSLARNMHRSRSHPDGWRRPCSPSGQAGQVAAGSCPGLLLVADGRGRLRAVHGLLPFQVGAIAHGLAFCVDCCGPIDTGRKLAKRVFYGGIGPRP